jgi:glycosyltransferase involved in cell wall biosynthesis
VNQHAAPIGGAEHYVANTAAALRERGVRSTLLYEVDGMLDRAFLRCFDAAFPLVDLPWQVGRIDPSVLYVHRLSGLEASRALASLSVPRVRFFHDHKLFCLREHKYTAVAHRTCTRPTGAGCYACLGFVQRAADRPGLAIRRLGALHAEQRHNRGLDRFVVGSRYMRDHVVAHGFDRERVSVVPLFAAPAASPPASPGERADVLFAGQLVRGKGLDTLLKAVRLTRSTDTLLVAGEGRQRREYEALCSELGLEHRVRFLGAVPARELTALLGRVKFLVVPSRSPETFAQVGIEAMAQATPVVAMDVGGIREWLDHGQTGLAVPAGDTRALAEAIDRVSADAVLRASFGRAAARAHAERFTPEAHLAGLEGVFEQVVPDWRHVDVDA